MSVPSSRRVQGPPPHLDPADALNLNPELRALIAEALTSAHSSGCTIDDPYVAADAVLALPGIREALAVHAAVAREQVWPVPDTNGVLSPSDFVHIGHNTLLESLRAVQS